MIDTRELNDKNLILLYGPSESGKSSIAREFLIELDIIRKGKKGQPVDQVEFKGKTLFEVGGKG